MCRNVHCICPWCDKAGRELVQGSTGAWVGERGWHGGGVGNVDAGIRMCLWRMMLEV
jgi:hypothetical protein